MFMILDAGALVAIDRGDRRVGTLLRVAQEGKIQVRTSAGVVAQVWRSGSRQARLARLLAGVSVQPLDAGAARQTGLLLARNSTADVIDAHLALLVGSGDHVLTSDRADLARLLEARGIEAVLIAV